MVIIILTKIPNISIKQYYLIIEIISIRGIYKKYECVILY